jgi:DNA-binding LytR/AlgR family response regulator
MRLHNQLNLDKKNLNETYNLLIVDDEPLVVKSLTSTITRYCNCNVQGLTDPAKALNLLSSKNSNIDLIILDYLMPNINGAKFVETLRKYNSKVFILLLTGHSQLAHL